MEDRRFGYVVVCMDQLTPDDPEEYHLATRRVFKTRDEATTYAATVARSRQPIVVNGRWFELRWATVRLCCGNNDTGCFDAACSCTCADCRAVHARISPPMLDCLAVPCPDCDAARGFPCTAGGRPRPPHVSRFRSFVTR